MTADARATDAYARADLRPCNPMLHAAYTPLLDPDGLRRLPGGEAAALRALYARRAMAPEQDLCAIDAEIVGRSYWYVLRPDEIARAIVGRRWRVGVAEATRILAACGEAGYDIAGNGAPQYEGPYLPTRGVDRDRLIWEAAHYWARAVTADITYISLGDCRGYLPRPVQYDQPGCMNPRQHAALTLGPAGDAYARQHTRRLLVVRP